MAGNDYFAIRPIGMGIPQTGADVPEYNYSAAIAANQGPSLWGGNGYGFGGGSTAGSNTTAGFQA